MQCVVFDSKKLNCIMLYKITAYSQHLKNIFTRTAKIHVPSDKSGWSLEWDIHFLKKTLDNLKIEYDVYRYLTCNAIYFVDKYKAINQKKILLRMHKFVALDYYHGDPSISPEFLPLLK